MGRLFGTSGIRMKNLSPKIAYKVGLAIAKKYKNVVVGRDTRTTGKLIETALTAGILNGGGEVTTIDIVPTPVLGFNARNYDAGVMITASHNPPEYNGIKLFNKNGLAFNKKEEDEIEEIIFKEDFVEVGWDKVGDIWEDCRAIRNYMEYILKNVEVNEKFNVVVDCANASACLVSPYLFTDIGCHVISVNSHMDGRFIGRLPEPDEKNLRKTMDMIKGLNMNGDSYIGIAHDGDADRMVAIDEKGRVADFDKLLAAFSRYMVEKTGNKKIVTTVDASMIIDEYLKDLDVEIIRTKVGDVAVAEEMIKNSAVFGGEPSGTWIHGDIHLTPDGILSGLRVLEMLEFYNKKLYEILDEIPSYVNLREKIPCEDSKKEKVMNYVIENGEEIFKTVPETVDGARFNLENGWVLIRPSGTEPYIRVRVEAKDKNSAKELLEKGIKLVKDALSAL
ncbi:phosphoglucosamine mutase [Methanocaldococcus bathoardescens]|uniref:Phosphoglucosamine mutase n=1 Tax=Methanocaldococcus bathoardescens TaxID=1301915 RepID=A0A076LBB4_9EURY|nr:phosphoglucosamine mutase [Methanocaldococcus bathoardescens]AIJ05640.1 phosphoglucosamine mutase [Methanocaldococcus bathoardescens]